MAEIYLDKGADTAAAKQVLAMAGASPGKVMAFLGHGGTAELARTLVAALPKMKRHPTRPVTSSDQLLAQHAASEEARETVLADAGVSEPTWITIGGTIGVDVKAESLEWELSKCVGPVGLRINSGGGVGSEGLAMYRALRAHKPGVVSAYIEGVAAGPAYVIACAADEVAVGPGAVLGIVGTSVQFMGTGFDIEEIARRLKTVHNDMAAIIAERFPREGRTREQVAALMNGETWCSRRQAFAGGWCDQTLRDDQIAPPLADPSFPFAYVYKNPPEALFLASMDVLPMHVAHSRIKVDAKSGQSVETGVKRPILPEWLSRI
jgi:ATP-dependent protease ClpP protease subunit